eukprot:7382729-Prymnesium_polylepis.1
MPAREPPIPAAEERAAARGTGGADGRPIPPIDGRYANARPTSEASRRRAAVHGAPARGQQEPPTATQEQRRLALRLMGVALADAVGGAKVWRGT